MPAKKRLGAALAAVAAALSGPGGADAATRHVPAEFATIGEAVAAADSGDVVLVEPGTYAESIVLAEGRGNGVTLQSAGGAEVTTISYPEGQRPDPNEAVVTIQRCSAATRFEGFTVDGRDVARRGVLVNSNARPVLSALVIRGCEYGVSSHRGSAPIVESVRVLESRTAGLFVEDAAMEVRGAELTDGAKFGVYVDGTQDTLRLRDLTAARNRVGLQVLAGDVLVDGGVFSSNSHAGMIFQGVSPEVRGAVVEDHPNIGIVMERCNGKVSACTIRGNRFGLVAAIAGAPRITRCTFQDNAAYQVGVEGDAAPVIGGSLDDANRFLGASETAVRSSSSARVDATHNDWGTACPAGAMFRSDAGGELLTSPWVWGDPPAVVGTCEEAGEETATTTPGQE